jgi:hypothetical protein
MTIREFVDALAAAIETLLHPPANPGPLLALIAAAMAVDVIYHCPERLDDLAKAQSVYASWLAQQGGKGRK